MWVLTVAMRVLSGLEEYEAYKGLIGLYTGSEGFTGSLSLSVTVLQGCHVDSWKISPFPWVLDGLGRPWDPDPKAQNLRAEQRRLKH